MGEVDCFCLKVFVFVFFVCSLVFSMTHLFCVFFVECLVFFLVYMLFLVLVFVFVFGFVCFLFCFGVLGFVLVLFVWFCLLLFFQCVI